MMTVLVVDDDSDQTFALGSVLKHYKYEVLTASSGSEGMDIVKESPINVLITDFVMPGKIRSIDLANCVKKLYPEAIVIFASGYDVDQDLIGNAIAVTKPITAEQIHELIVSELKGLQSEKNKI